MLVDFADRHDLGGGAGEEHFVGVGELFRHDHALDHLMAALTGEVHHRSPGDAVEKAVRRRRVQHAVLRQEDIGAGGLGDLPAPIEHQRVVIAFRLDRMARQGADHVKSGGLGLDRRGVGRGAAPFRGLHADAALTLFVAEQIGPRPGGDGDMGGGDLGRDAHHFAAAPGDGPDIAVDDILRHDHFVAGGVDLVRCERDRHIELLRRFEQSLGMFLKFEDAPRIGALALEDTAAVMQRVAQHMQFGVAPRHHFAVEPHHAAAVVKGYHVGHFCSFSRTYSALPRRKVVAVSITTRHISQHD